MQTKRQNQQKNSRKEPSIRTAFSNDFKSVGLPLILAFCLPVLLYLQTLSFGFTYFDDDRLILNNADFLSQIGNALKAFQTDAFMTKTSQFYRPLQTVSYLFDVLISGGNNAWMFHLTNILLLGFISGLLFLLLRRFLIPPTLALLSTLVFCMHPLFISTVAWIPARGDLLLLAFSLLSFLFFLDFLRTKKTVYLILNWTAFTLALFSKETAVSLPLIFILGYFAFAPEKRFEKRQLLAFVLYSFSGIIWFWLRFQAIGDFSGIPGESEKVGLLPFISNLRTIPETLALFFVPVDIAFFQSFSLLKTGIGLALIVSIGILLSRNKEHSGKEMIFGFAWFLLLLLPTLLYKNELVDYLNHRFFLPLIGILLLVLFSIPKKWLENTGRKFGWVLGILTVVFSFFTYTNSRFYSGMMPFYNAATAQNPNSPLAFNNRGSAFQKEGQMDKAISDYTKAIELKHDYSTAYNNRGNIYLNQKQFEDAVADFTKVIELKYANASTYNNRGVAYIRLGLYDKACADFKKALELGSSSAQANLERFCKKEEEY